MRKIDDPEAEARRIVDASGAAVRDYVHRAIKERWLSSLVHGLNSLEHRPATRSAARQALRKIGFPMATQ
jgi:hypothetical protein